MKRRDFIKNTTTAVTLPVLLNGLKLAAFAKPLLFNTVNNASDRVLVLIQLNGGNDGLNMVIPLDQYSHLFSARAEIMIPENKVIPLTEALGLNPAMTGVKALFDEATWASCKVWATPTKTARIFVPWKSGARPRRQTSFGIPAGWDVFWMKNFRDFPTTIRTHKTPILSPSPWAFRCRLPARALRPISVSPSIIPSLSGTWKVAAFWKKWKPAS